MTDKLTLFAYSSSADILFTKIKSEEFQKNSLIVSVLYVIWTFTDKFDTQIYMRSDTYFHIQPRDIDGLHAHSDPWEAVTQLITGRRYVLKVRQSRVTACNTDREWMNKWMNEWINEWMHEWMNEWSKSIIYIYLMTVVFTGTAIYLSIYLGVKLPKDIWIDR